MSTISFYFLVFFNFSIPNFAKPVWKANGFSYIKRLEPDLHETSVIPSFYNSSND